MNTLMHICCAPCANQPIAQLRVEGLSVTGFWFNPNIHPYTEYQARKATLEGYAKEIGMKLIIGGRYDLRSFITNVADNIDGRCAYCYRVRMEETAKYAAQHGFDSFTTSLLISPYQKHEAIAAIAREMGQQYGVEFLYRDFRPLFRAGQDYAREHGLGMHVHISETRTEHAECLARHGKTPIQVLNDYGVWDVRAIAAHCVWTTEDDWAGMAEKGVACVHNPVSNLKLGSGVAWIPAMKAAGVPIALGTDGVSSNNNQDMFEEMKFAAVLHNGVTRDPLALLPQDVLAMATREGAKALGRQTGRIAPGYVADLILVDFTRPHLTPCHSVMDNLVYAAHGSDVVMNMARGKIIYKDGTFLTLDLEKIQAEVKSYALPRLFGDGKTW